MDSKEFREAGKQMIDYIADYFENIEKLRVIPNVKPGFLLQTLPTAAPQQGEDFSQIFSDFESQIMPGIYHWNSPRFSALYPCGVSYPSILGELLGSALSGVCFSWEVNPSATELEIVVLDWLGKMLELPKEFIALDPEQGKDGKRGGGVIQGSATESVIVAMLAARRRALDRLKKEYPNKPESALLGKLVGYSSKLTHGGTEKSKLICAVELRLVDTDDQGVIDADLLARAIEEDVKAGLHPFFFCANLGTTIACSYDNLQEIGPICKQWNIWVHVDAAYAGTFFICPEFRHYTKGVEFADSFNFNCHKLMLTNFDCSPLWVKDRTALINALSVDRSYFKDDDTGIVTDFRKWQLPLGRRFRALKLWFVLRSFGVEGIQRHARKNIERTQLFESLVEKDDRFEFWPRKPNLGLVCFRLKEGDEVTKKLANRINSSGKFSLSVVLFKNQTIIRFHGGCFTEERHVHEIWRAIQNETETFAKYESITGEEVFDVLLESIIKTDS